MKAMESDWYKKIWTLDIQDQSWVEDTARQVDFLEEKLNLKKGEKILDLACGFGRHALELARRGYDVTGVDISVHRFCRAAGPAGGPDSKLPLRRHPGGGLRRGI